ncbi:hypothetical protein LTR84_002985 [Exophiala bonariae]|uniref:Uncharacterized protein n=1 Tax=Exophiala bonariae TaxID=1690606 RepID=A0AAV9N7E1_9EURO|nr:hypothetical protein LTR84_002985 [Exophiala bonariae]
MHSRPHVEIVANEAPMIPDFINWHSLSLDAKLCCIAPIADSATYIGWTAWMPTNRLDHKWNDECGIFEFIKDFLKQASSEGKLFRRAKGLNRMSAELQLLSNTGRREDATPYVVLLHPEEYRKEAGKLIERLRTTKLIMRLGFKVTGSVQNIVISGADVTSAFSSGISTVHEHGHAKRSACGMQISVRPVATEASGGGRLATIGGVLELRPNRYFGLTSAHIFAEPNVTDEYSENDSENSDQEFGFIGDGHSREAPKEHYIFKSASEKQDGNWEEFDQHRTSLDSPTRQIGTAFSPAQQSEFSIDMLYNATLDWALVEITDPGIQFKNFYEASDKIVRPRPDPRRTKPFKGDVFVLSDALAPQKCRSSGSRSAISVDWGDGFVEVWRIECKSDFGSCGSWVVDPVDEIVLGILVAHSEDQSLSWMLPAGPIFADIESRWGVDLAAGARPLTSRQTGQRGLREDNPAHERVAWAASMISSSATLGSTDGHLQSLDRAGPRKVRGEERPSTSTEGLQSPSAVLRGRGAGYMRYPDGRWKRIIMMKGKSSHWSSLDQADRQH